MSPFWMGVLGLVVIAGVAIFAYLIPATSRVGP